MKNAQVTPINKLRTNERNGGIGQLNTRSGFRNTHSKVPVALGTPLLGTERDPANLAQTVTNARLQAYTMDTNICLSVELLVYPQSVQHGSFSLVSPWLRRWD